MIIEQGPVIIASSQGGVNIEEVAAENPDAILYEPIDIVKGLTKEQAVKVAEKLGLANVSDLISQTLLNMYDLFVKKDALLIEINPYAEDAFDTSKCKRRFSFIVFFFNFDNLRFFFFKSLQTLPWTQNFASTIQPSTVKRNYSNCAITPKKIKKKWLPPNSIWTTSHWTERSVSEPITFQISLNFISHQPNERMLSVNEL